MAIGKTEITELDKKRIVEAIQQFESKTSGEIRIHIDEICEGDSMNRAVEVFNHLELYKTKERNAILFYFSLFDKKMAIIGDKGIHERVPEGFWDESKETMVQLFRQNKLIEGILAGIEKSGKALSDYFPKSIEDKNELSDEITTQDDV
jgi:uncharacterized membrane protein